MKKCQKIKPYTKYLSTRNINGTTWAVLVPTDKNTIGGKTKKAFLKILIYSFEYWVCRLSQLHKTNKTIRSLKDILFINKAIPLIFVQPTTNNNCNFSGIVKIINNILNIENNILLIPFLTLVRKLFYYL